MKKIILVLSLLIVVGCSVACTNVKNADKSAEEIVNEEKASEVEMQALENIARFDCSVNDMSKILQKNSGLSLKKDNNLCVFEDLNKQFEIQLGSWDTDISEIYYTIYDEKPMDNKKISDSFFESVEEIFTVFSEKLDKEKIQQEFLKVTTPDQSVEFNYSEKIRIYIGKMGKDFDFRIYPQNEE